MLGQWLTKILEQEKIMIAMIANGYPLGIKAFLIGSVKTVLEGNFERNIQGKGSVS